MKQFRLKPNQPAFEAVDGPLAGRRFVHGRVYAEIPPADRERFEKVAPAKAAEKKRQREE